jgi:hypothetical protein
MCVWKRNRTDRSSIRMGWDYIVSEDTVERFMFRPQTGYRSVMSFRVFENEVVWTPWGRRNSDWDGVCSCVWRVNNKLHISHEPCVWRHRFYMTTKSPTLNISVFVPSSVRDFQKPGNTRLSRVFVVVIHCTHTLTCIIRCLHLHVSTANCMSKVWPSCPPWTVTWGGGCTVNSRSG